MAVYSFVEAELNSICEGIRRRKNLPSSFRDLPHKRGIDRARAYLTSVAGVNFPAQLEIEWSALKDYQKLRNCLAHAQGHLASCGKDGEHLEKDYIPKHPHLSISGGEVILHKGFCDEVIGNAYTFFAKLGRVL